MNDIHKRLDVDEDIYVKLRRHLNTFILRAPESEAILEILRIRFTPDEAEAGLHLGQIPKDLSTLSESAKMNMEDLRSILERMADKALILKKTKFVDGEKIQLYSLLPTAVGLWETSFARGEISPKTIQLARYWREYYLEGWGQSMFPGNRPFTRVIPIESAVSSSKEVFPYEKAQELIKEHDYICVLHCPCRMAASLVGDGCDHPTEVCFHFGDLAKFFIEKGYAREVGMEEALAILDLTMRSGLVHMVGNSKEMGVALCSCCTCCCTQLRAIKEFSIPNSRAMAPSRFVAKVDHEKCTICGECEHRCQFDAIVMEDESAATNMERCLGCGLCVMACPEDAISLEERSYYKEPVEKGIDLIKAFACEDATIESS